ncbi:DNA adenine methylase [Paraburkholderia dipogonis]|uniref:DNA adenine methylase n=1 Tax=Paraburkholderia dipogonis TaxID=1211383 RepID=UPI0035E8471D
MLVAISRESIARSLSVFKNTAPPPSTVRADVLTRAAQFLYLNKFGFNGLCRYNRSGQFTYPMGTRYGFLGFLKKKSFLSPARRSGATFVHGDFADLVRSAQPGDVVYCDPPYLDRDDSPSFRGYGAAGFGMDRQRELADLARELAQRGIPVAISNHDCVAAYELYEGANILTFPARRSVSAAAGFSWAMSKNSWQFFGSQ